MGKIKVINFSHVSMHVNDLSDSILFYKDFLGLEELFDVQLDGPGLEAVTQSKDVAGRMVGFLVQGGGMVELVEGVRDQTVNESVSVENDSLIFSLCVENLGAAYTAVVQSRYEPLHAPAEIAGVKMFFIRDPDGRRIELIEFSDGATRSSELHGYLQ